MPEHGAYIGGDWLATCDICGLTYYASKLAQAWDNSMRCSSCWEPRHPQDFVRAMKDIQSVDWARVWAPSLSQCLTLTDSTTPSVTIAPADASKFPVLTFGQVFYATLSNDTGYETVAVSSVAGGTVLFTSRGLFGTIRQVWPAGSYLTAISGAITP